MLDDAGGAAEDGGSVPDHHWQLGVRSGIGWHVKVHMEALLAVSILPLSMASLVPNQYPTQRALCTLLTLQIVSRG